MRFDYKSSNFISTPATGDKRIRIYDKNKNLRFSIEPELSYFYVNNNCVVIKVTNKNDITLSFETKRDALLAISKLIDVKRFFVNTVSSNILGYIYSSLNLNMPASATTANGDLACDYPVLDTPRSHIRVKVNGVEYNAASPSTDLNAECFFAPGGLSGTAAAAAARQKGGEQKGDYLYWIGEYWGDYNVVGAGFQLTTNDDIDFIFLTDP